MKKFFACVAFLTMSVGVGAQTFDVVKINKQEVAINLNGHDEVSYQLPLKYPFKMPVYNLEVFQGDVLVGEQKVGSVNNSRLKLNDGTKLFFEKKGNVVTITNGKKEVYSKAVLNYNEDYDFLESIIITENTFKDKALMESWILYKTIKEVTYVKKDTSDDLLYGLAIGNIIATALAR